MKSITESELNKEYSPPGENNAFWFFTIVLGIISCLLQVLLPWWILVVASWLFGYITIPKRSFLIGMLSNFLVWLIYCIIIDIKNESLLSAKIVELTGLHYITLLILLISLFAGIMGGLACMSGKFIRQAYIKHKKQYNPEELRMD